MQGTGALAEIFGLERQDEDLFVAAPVESKLPRTYGGQVAAQGLRAAMLTVGPDRPVHSLHSYFIRPGQSQKPLSLRVQRTRDGKTFSTRHVTAFQDGKPTFELLASFHVPEDGEDWQPSSKLEIDPPEGLPEFKLAPHFGQMPTFEVRPLVELSSEGWPLRHPFWLRVREPIDDPSLHACLITYISDVSAVQASLPIGSRTHYETAVSLDHSLHFHRPVRADQWLLYSMDSHVNHGARGLARGTMHTQDGTLVASVSQETLLRLA